MQKFKLVGIVAMTLLLTASLDLWAQPGGGGGRGCGGRGGARGGAQVLRFLPLEQILGYLVFNEDVALSNDQLVKVREVLKVAYSGRAELQRSLRGNNDQQAAMSQVRKLRTEMTQGLSTILNDDQTKALQTYMQRMNQRGGRGGQGGRGSGRGSGGRRGGGGGGGA